MDNLRDNLIRWGLLIIIVVSTFYIAFFIRHGIYRLEDEKIQYLKTVMRLQQDTILRKFYTHIIDVRMLSKLDSVRSLDKDRMRQDFKVFLQTQVEYSNLVYVNDKGTIEIDTSGIADIAKFDNQYLHQALLGNDYISNIIIDSGTQQPFIIISVPVYDSEMHIKGAIFATIKADNLLYYLDSDAESEPFLSSYLIKRDGTILTFEGFKFDEEISRMLDDDRLNIVFNKSNNEPFYIFNFGRNIIIFCRLFEGKDWALLGKIDKTHYLKIMDDSIFEVIAGLVIIILFAVMGMIIISNRIVRPIEILEQAAKKICDGDYKYHVDFEQFKKVPKEIKLFSDTFFKMQKIVAEKEELWAKYSMLVEDTQNIILFIDCRDGKIIEANKAAEVAYGYPVSELTNMHINELLASEHVLYNNVPNVYEAWHKTKSGQTFPVEVRTQYAEVNGVAMCMNIICNITERKRYEQRLIDLSYLDELTGLYNRNFFEEKVHELEKKGENRLGVIVADLDELKLVNDSRGHQSGDQLIINAAKLLRQSVRDNDIIARIGGDEFVIILRDVDEPKCRQIMDRIKKNCNPPLSMSLGCAVNTGGESIHELFCRADRDMYYDKKQSKQKLDN